MDEKGCGGLVSTKWDQFILILNILLKIKQNPKIRGLRLSLINAYT
ncbi:hypothetical protein MJ1HA_2083 [Metallosphaera sedula]|nr:hypothetical protein MJ1HA_2083 [Metallosphaera sedula]